MRIWITIVFAIAATAHLSGCDGPPPAQRCNGDVDCESGNRCVDGLCAPSEQGPEVVVEPAPAPEPSPQPEPESNDGGQPEPSDGGAPEPTPEPTPEPEPEDAGPPPVSDWPQWPNVATLSFPPQADQRVENVVLPVAISVASDILGDESLRITTQDQVLVAFERTPSTLWIRVPEIDPIEGAVLNLYFGAEAPAAGHRADPWPDARGVWHLDTAAIDSSPLDNAGTTPGALIDQGVIGGARQITRGQNPAVTPETEGIRLPADQPYIGNASAISVAFWVRVDDIETSLIDREFVSILGTSTTVYSRMLFTLDNGVSYRFRAAAIELSPMLEPPATDVDLSQWTFLVGTANFPSGEIALFENGVEVARDTMRFFEGGASLNAPSTFDERNPLAAFGSEDNGVEDVMNGALDEIRLLERALTPPEVATMHAYEAAGGTLAVVGPTQSRPLQDANSDFIANDDAVEVVADVPTVFDVRSNDQSALPLTVTTVDVLAGDIDVAIRSDGRLRIEMFDPGVVAEATITLTDGTPGGQRTSLLTITSDDGTGDPLECHAFSVHVLPSQAFSFQLDELARVEDNGPLVIVEAEATAGSAITEPNAVHYSAASGDLDVDFLRVTVSDGLYTCVARVALLLDATLPPAQEIVLPFDIGLSNAFSFPFAAAGLDDTATIFFDGNHVDDSPHPRISALSPGDFWLQPSGVARDSTLFFAAQTIDGELHASTRARIDQVLWAEEDFDHRVRVVINRQFLDANLYKASTTVDLASLDSSDLPRFEGTRIYAAGSRALLPIQNEASVTPTQPAKVRTLIPVVRVNGPENYFWVYFNHQDGEAPTSAPSDVVWGDDVAGAWSFSRDLSDQTQNGNDATSAAPLNFSRAGASLANTPPNGLMLPAIELSPPFTIEVYFEPINTWAAPLQTQAIVTRTSHDKSRAVGVVWAGADLATDVQPPFTNALVGRAGVVGLPGAGTVTSFRRGADLTGDEAIYVSAVIDVEAPNAGTALVTEAQTGPTQVASSGPPPQLPSGTAWIVGPSTRIGDESFIANCDCRIRSVRLRRGLMSADRSAYQRRSDNRQLLSFGTVQSP